MKQAMLNFQPLSKASAKSHLDSTIPRTPDQLDGNTNSDLIAEDDMPDFTPFASAPKRDTPPPSPSLPSPTLPAAPTSELSRKKETQLARRRATYAQLRYEKEVMSRPENFGIPKEQLFPGRYIEKNDHDETVYCFCKKEDIGEGSIECADPECKIRWYHNKCVRYNGPGNDGWTCDNCKKREADKAEIPKNGVPGSLKTEDLEFILRGGRIFVNDPYGLSSWRAKVPEE